MPRRQIIGLRKNNTGAHKKGKARRQSLVTAAFDLLCKRPIEEISFSDIARKADVPEGSTYHFFANRFDVFTEVANQLSDQFVEIFQQAVPARRRGDWQSLVGYLLESSSEVYNNTPAARQLLIGGKTPPEIKQMDRLNEQQVGVVLGEIFDRYFEMPKIPRSGDVFYYFIELTDLMFSLSVIKHDKITKQMHQEAVRVGIAYLGSYLPEKLVPR